MPRLVDQLHALDGRGYPAYRDLLGTHQLDGCRLIVDRVQADPFAPPSLMRLVVDPDVAALPPHLLDDRVGLVAVADFLLRAVAAELAAETGTGREAVSVGHPGQEVLERTGIHLGESIEARLTVPLPAAGRRIKGHAAARLLTEVLPRAAERALRHASLNAGALEAHVRLLRDQEWLRAQLKPRGLTAFVADGAVLPRRSGDSDLPLTVGAVPFSSPASLRVEFDTPSGARITGMGLSEGVTVIVGGGYHGKSTLLRAIERGVHPHVGGDGREWVITRADAVSVRAEDGRPVVDEDISPFITGLPSGTDTQRFSTTNASGSTSQAANVAEAVAAGASVLLVDEDTSATNFMIRDERMRRLVSAEREPITPFIDRVRPLADELGVSTVVVAGGSGAFFDVADRVVALDAYVPSDVTEEARSIAAALPRPDRGQEAHPAHLARMAQAMAARTPAKGALEAVPDAAGPGGRSGSTGRGHRSPGRDGGRRRPARARGRDTIQLGEQNIDLGAVVGLVDAEQTAGVAAALDVLSRLLDGRTRLVDAVGQLEELLERDGPGALAPGRAHPGHLTRPRRHEILAAVDRLRGLRLN